MTSQHENLGINFNVATVPFFHHTEDLSRFPEFVDKLKSYKRCEIVLHGLYHEDRKGHMDDFHTKSKGTTEEEIRAGLEIFEQIGLRTSVFIPPQWGVKLGLDRTSRSECCEDQHRGTSFQSVRRCARTEDD